MKKTLRIGKNRNKARIWIEGQALAAQGWAEGAAFLATFHAGRITYERVIDGTPRSRKVAGTDTRPIIDTNTDKILDSLGDDATHVDLHISEGNIVMTKGKAPSKTVTGAAALILAATAIAAPFISQFNLSAKRVLVACEESATVRDEFTKRGHDAVSCDILDTRNPYGWHIKGDVTPYLDQEWEIVIGFPPCTVLNLAAAWAFKDADYEKYPGFGYHQKVKPETLTGHDRRVARVEAIAFAKRIYEAGAASCVENPNGFLNTMWMKPTQVIQPHQYGHSASKATCLRLRNLPELVPTNILDIEEHGWLVTTGAHAGKWRWNNQTSSGQNNLPPSPDRAMLRSKTYLGVGAAMAEQWGGDLS